MISLLNAANDILNDDIPLHPRLLRFYAALAEQQPPITDTSLTALQLETARAALHVLHRVQLLLDAAPRDTQDAPAIGTRDLTVLRTLLTLLFRWGINTLLARLAPLWHTSPPLSDPSTLCADLTALSALLSTLMSTLFPRGVRAQPSQTLITTTILDRHVPDLLRASMTLAWLPKSLWPQDNLSLHTLRPSVLRLLELCVYMRCVSAQMNLNLVAKSPSVPDNDRSRRSIIEHAPAPASCPQIMFVVAHKEPASSGRYSSSLCRSFR